ncbi:MAG: DEAD/DEAH box helicase [Leptospiraceae bacterium]|nr:DEAD/DEAH box helicase [Leptospiraceae bacterium]MDW7976084.1 DEAD/DEAH box helicase [Leptospiraceae bacterium]
MKLQQILTYFKNDPYFSKRIKHIIEVPPKEPVFVDFPEDLDESIQNALRKRNIHKLYYHQFLSYQYAKENKNVLITTSTASGKTLGYFLPILQHKLRNPASRVIFMYPTKALSRDQEQWMKSLCGDLEFRIGIYTYDGDTEDNLRKRIRYSGDFIITNPDMVHVSMLPNHNNLWQNVFENLDFIVIDEAHTYRGIFGSHFANLLRRLFRIASFYGREPKIFAASATIGNPKEFIEKLTEKEFEVVSEDSSEKGRKYFIFYDVPRYVIDETSRNLFQFDEEKKEIYFYASPLKEAVKLAEIFVKYEIPTIIFGKTRKHVELLTNYLKKQCPEQEEKIQAYRSGYLPEERRQIESDLRSKKIVCVISTNALELGIDIGSLEVSISVGYPGSIHSFHQQAGRAGRKSEVSLSILIASESSIDQYIIKHPDFIMKKNPESARINPNNLWIVSEHIKCTVAEKPFVVNESFGKYQYAKEILKQLEKNQLVIQKNERFYWGTSFHPAHAFSLRSGPKKNFTIIDTTTPEKKVIGEMDYYSAPLLLHPEAIYIHQTKTYFVEELDWEKQIANVKQIDTDYYTEAEEKVLIKPLQSELAKNHQMISVYKGEISISSTPILYKKIKFYTNENVGHGVIHLPEITMHTQSVWLVFARNFFEHEPLSVLLQSLSHALALTSTIIAMFEKNDLRFACEVMDTYYNQPCIYFFDNFPGGLEISYVVLSNFSLILEETIRNIQTCDCEKGCPACIGLAHQNYDDHNINFKTLTIHYLDKILTLLKDF